MNAGAAALCNLVLEFSQAREAVLRCQGVERLAVLAGSTVPSLRLSGIWALRNMSYSASSSFKQQVMKVGAAASHQQPASHLANCVLDSRLAMWDVKIYFSSRERMMTL